jgi:hypothetical protein
MKLDVMLYGIKDETITLNGEKLELLATCGAAEDYEEIRLVRTQDGKYRLYTETEDFESDAEDREAELLFENDTLQGLFDDIFEEDEDGLGIIWDQRAEEVDDILDRNFDSYTEMEVYAEELISQEEQGFDMTEARAEFEEVFDCSVDDAL